MVALRSDYYYLCAASLAARAHYGTDAYYPAGPLFRFPAENVTIVLPHYRAAVVNSSFDALDNFAVMSLREQRTRRVVRLLYRAGVIDVSLSAVDAGANIGDFAVPLAAVLGRRTRR